jgi:hypothetical protein
MENNVVELPQNSSRKRSLKQKAESAQSILAQTSTSITALRAAKKLLGSYANLRPSDPEQFACSVVEVLSLYPAGLVDECVDARTGIAGKIEFLSIRSLTEWLDSRQEFYRGLSGYVERQPEKSGPLLSVEHRERMAMALRGLSRLLAKSDPIGDKTFDEIVEIGRE